MKSVRSVFFVSLLTFFSQIALAQDYLAGNWTVEGADISRLGLNLSGGSNPYLVISKSGSLFNAHINQDVFVSEINCSVSTSLNLFEITPTSANQWIVKTTYPAPLICISLSKSYDITVSNLSADQNSFTTCETSKPDNCLTWNRVGTSPAPPVTEICSKSLKPSPPTATVTGKKVKVTIPGSPSGVKSYIYELVSKKTPKVKKTTITVNSKNKTINRGGLHVATWAVRYKATCSAKGAGASKYSPYTGFTIN